MSKKGRQYWGIILALILVVAIIHADTVSTRRDTQKVIKTASTITEVTVFPDRAGVVRSVSKFLPKGEHLLLFDSLPEAVDEDSVRVSGKGAAVLKEVNVRETRFKKIPIKDVQQLFDQKQHLEDQLEALEDKKEQVEKEKEFLDKITQKLTGVTEKSQPSELDPDKWIKMVAFYRSKLESLDKDIRDAEKSEMKLEEQKQQIEWKIKGMEEQAEKTKYQVTVKVVIEKEGKISLNLSYIIDGPKWVPVYDLHVFSGAREKRMKVKYQAFVKQNTGEDWNNVSLKLSTAKPALGARHPDLSAWYIGFRPPRKKPAKPISPQISAADSAVNMFSVERVVQKSFLGPEDDQLEEDIASVEAGSTSVVFAVNGKSTIKSSKSKHKVTIMIKDLPVHFRYSAAPKLKPYAYLKALVTNDTHYPLLPGESNVFLDNSFISRSELASVAVGQKFWTFLGVDEGIRVKYDKLEPFNQNKGFLKKKNKLVYRRYITINYHKKTSEELVVWDQLPISKDEAIKVQLTQPVVNGKTRNIKLSKKNLLEWFFKPQPGEEIKIPLEFSVEYPRDRAITGHLRK
jgi:uncharacterized protein (TIGR02231 family)